LLYFGINMQEEKLSKLPEMQQELAALDAELAK
jgi:hypothetical protein